MTTRAIVKAGVCSCTIDVTSTSKQRIGVHIFSGCKKINKMSEQIKELNWLPIFGKEGGSFFNTVLQFTKHPSCPVFLALLKAIEVEVGLAALPGDTTIRLKKM